MKNYKDYKFLNFARAGDHVFAIDDIAMCDFSQIESLIVRVHLKSSPEVLIAKDIHAIELAMKIQPSIVESKRLKFARHHWSIHNLFGHPLMQIMAFFHRYKLAFWFHDVTVPTPQGKKEN